VTDAAQRARTAFEAALEISAPAERERFVTERCAGDEELLARVRELLVAHEEAGDFLRDEAPLSPEIELELARLKPEEAGDRIGPYRLLEPLGEGGFGVVWMAEQVEPVRRRVALKIIKMGMDTKEVIARFEQERQALAMMEHPNIAKVFDAGATQFGRPFFVMELVRGIPITTYCDQSKLPTVERLRLFISVCHALQHAHQKGIIHRDLKPSNILVTLHDGGPVPKVIDFGVAKATQQRLTDLTVFTQFEQMIGTPLYMSPEQAEMSGLDVDTRSDIYSLGVLLYELLTGRTPFDAEELMRRGYDEIRRMIREQEPPKPSTAVSTMAREAAATVAQHQQLEPPKLVGRLRGDLDWIVMKALEKDRSRRYETANGFAMDIERHLAGEPIIARPPTTLYRLDRLVRRNKLAFTAAAGVMLALVVGAGFSMWQAREAEREAERARGALDDLLKTAPAFAEQARTLATREEFDEALEKLDTAAKLRPDVADYRVARGDLLQSQLRLADAAVEYRTALAISPEHPRAKANAGLCNRLLAANSDPTKLAPENLRELAAAMEREHRPAAQRLAVARRLGEEKKVLLDYWIERLADLPLPPERPLAERLTLCADGLLALDLKDTRLSDLSALAGVPLGEINATGCTELKDLQPLRALPLTALFLAGSGVTDLAPLSGVRTLKSLDLSKTAVRDFAGLRGLPLQTLVISDTPGSDLSPLAGMPLQRFQATNLAATDCSPLAGSPLETCVLNGTKVTDLGFLKNAPLRKLDLTDSPDARNFAALAGCQTLESIKLPATALNLPPEDLDAITALRDLPALKTIVADQGSQKGPIAAASSAEFWKQWDLLITVARPLRAAGIWFRASIDSDGSLYLNLTDQPIRDLSILEGAPITRLDMAKTKVADLSPLRTMKRLSWLQIKGTPVTDLSPLRGLPLDLLNIGETTATDLSPLEGMPLTVFYADGSAVTDFAPLARISTLASILLPMPKPGAPPLNIEPLRNLPKLQRLSFTFDQSVGPVCTAKGFWAHWDGLGWLRALQDGEFRFSAKQLESGQWEVHLGHETRFTDCSIFKGAHLVSLNLENTGVEDLSPLRDIPLELLDTGRTQVTDVSTLRGSTLARSVKVFSLYDTRVADFSPVAECVNLTQFNACETALQDLGFLENLTACTIVAFTNTAVTDISVLSKMPTLKKIYLPWEARDVEQLRQLPNLRGISYDYEGGKKQTAEEFWQMHDELPWFAELKAKGITATVERRGDGLWEVDLQKQPIADLTPLRGSSIWFLDIMNTPVADLEPLRGMPLEGLNIRDTQVADLEPLRGMPLEVLAIGGTKVTDLAPLAGMRLKTLHLASCQVKDISVVRGMPLRYFGIGGGASVDLAPLHEINTLVLINPSWGSTNIDGLRRLPNVERLGYGWDGSKGQIDTSVEEFWQIHDELPGVGELRAKGIKVDASRREDGRWVVKLNEKRFSDCSIFKGAQIAVLSLNGTNVTDLGPLRGLLLSHLDISNTNIEDLSPLEGMPLTSLNMQTTKVTDLGPLRGMKLTSLFTCDSPVTDLSSLRGLPLTYLNISNCPVKDLSPLEEMPLITFHAWKCRVLSDYTPLARIQTLREILLGPIDAEAPRMEIEALRGLPNVESLSFEVDDGRPVTTAKEFWAEFDRKRKP
jgi:serine/threonine protein kinase/Leucine-rich repeat (LRR) protein